MWPKKVCPLQHFGVLPLIFPITINVFISAVKQPHYINSGINSVKSILTNEV